MVCRNPSNALSKDNPQSKAPSIKFWKEITARSWNVTVPQKHVFDATLSATTRR
jgi:hypothetical protein